MPMLMTAQKRKWLRQPPYNFYHFPEEHRPGWTKFWESMDGDMDKILEFAEKADVECPKEWFESLHKFLFDAFAGNPKLLKCASEKSFGEFLKQTSENHENDPKNKQWYNVRGITQNDFVAMLERASDIKDVRQAVAFVNARVKDLGFSLYSEYLLSRSKGKSEIEEVASKMNKQAYDLEVAALNHSPLSGIKEGHVVTHALHPDDKFMVTEVVTATDGSIDMLVARDTNGKVAFVKDLWNVRVW